MLRYKLIYHDETVMCKSIRGDYKLNGVSDTILDLNDGNKLPQLGFGCYKVPGNITYQTIQWAIDAGYRHIDTATFYENEAQVGRGVREAKIDREQIFVVSKMWPIEYQHPEKGIEYSLKQLNLDYLDAYLLHWPGLNESLRYKAWEAMIKYQEKGWIKSIGVSNFLIHHLEGLIDQFGVIPSINQIELHPWSQKTELCHYCRQKGITINAWGPIFRGHISEVPLLTDMAKKYGKSPVQLTIRWHLQHGVALVPKSSRQERIIQNSQVFDFELSELDMKRIDDLECGKHFGQDPDCFPAS